MREPVQHRSVADEVRFAREVSEAMGARQPPSVVYGLLIGALVAAVLSVTALEVSYGDGPPDHLYGIVTGFGLQETAYGSLPMVRVAVDGREVTVRVPSSSGCQVGDSIALLRRKLLAGYVYGLDAAVCSGPAAANGPVAVRTLPIAKGVPSLSPTHRSR